MPRPRQACGFTLVELLVVIAIIALMMTLLVPTISKATEQVRAIQTRGTLKEISIGLESFRKDFGDLPPSRPAIGFDSTTVTDLPYTARPTSTTFTREDVARGEMGTGAANLVYYLGGPQRSGWGLNAGGVMPSAYSVDAPNQKLPLGGSPPAGLRAVLPVLRGRRSVRNDQLQGASRSLATAFLDAYKPAGSILYLKSYKRELVDSSVPPKPYIIRAFDPSDNNRKDLDSSLLNNKYNYTRDVKGLRTQQAMFDLAVGVWSKSAGKRLEVKRYPAQDYMLIAPGPDGRFGWVDEDTMEPLDPDSETGMPQCDDIANWER